MGGRKDRRPAEDVLRDAERFRREGKLKSAERCYRRILEADAADAAALHGQATLLLERGRVREAVPLLFLLLDQAPDSADGNYAMGVALEAMGEAQAALDHYRKALAARPDHADAYNNIGNILYALGNGADAFPWFVRAIAAQPNHARSHANLGVVLREYGHNDKAVMAFERAIDLEPANAEFYRLLGEARPFTAEDRHLAGLMALARGRRRLPAAQRIELGFACAKAYEDIGAYDESFRHMLEGNALKRRTIAYDEAESLGFLRRIEAVFTPALMRDRHGSGSPSPAPVFIFGMPRSGSTLIEQILAAHPAVASLGEDGSLGDAVERMTGSDGTPFPECFPGMVEAAIAALGADYLGKADRIAPGAARIVNKMLGHFAIAGPIHLLFPNARFIHMRRDPVDNCLSCFSRLFDKGLPYTFDLGELARFYRAYERLMAHWRRVLPDGVMIEVQYEAFVGDSERQTRRILAHCGLEWHEACRDFWRSNRPVRTASVSQVRQPVYRSAVDRSRHYAAARARLLAELGGEA